MGLQNYGIFYLLNTPYIELNNKHSLSQTDDFFIYKLNACTLYFKTHHIKDTIVKNVLV